jgi:Ca2+-binding EF-hand superfamily protein
MQEELAMNIKYITLSGALSLIGGLLFSPTLFAEENGNDKLFQALDLNSDKMISAQELVTAKRLVSDFNKYDTNKNGSIEAAEFDAIMSAKAFIPVEEENEPIGAAPSN